MLKPSITVLHRLPNRIRFQLSESINNIEEFKKTMMEDKLVVLFRYNPQIIIRTHTYEKKSTC